MCRSSMQMRGTMHFFSGYGLIEMPRGLHAPGASICVPPWSAIAMNIDDKLRTLPDSANVLVVFHTP